MIKDYLIKKRIKNKIKNKIKKVYVVYVDNNLNFFNCDFLLNKYEDDRKCMHIFMQYNQ